MPSGPFSVKSETIVLAIVSGRGSTSGSFISREAIAHSPIRTTIEPSRKPTLLIADGIPRISPRRH